MHSDHELIQLVLAALAGRAAPAVYHLRYATEALKRGVSRVTAAARLGIGADGLAGGGADRVAGSHWPRSCGDEGKPLAVVFGLGRRGL